MGLGATTGLAGTKEQDTTLTIEFLEFLADWETDQGDWVGPDSFIDDSFDQLYEVDLDKENDDEHEE
jgi:hypothetical protein